MILLGTPIDNGAKARRDALNIADYHWNNALMREPSWQPLRDISGDPAYDVSGNAGDNRLWYPQTDGKPVLLLLGNSHSKDLFNALQFSATAQARFVVTRYGAELHRLGPAHALFSSPNYRQASHVLLTTRYDDERDPLALPRLIERLRRDGKIPVVVLNTPEFTSSRVSTLADDVVREILRDSRAIPHPEAHRVDAAHWQDLQNNTALKDRNAALRAIAGRLGVPALDRADYACDSARELCFAISERLGKYYYDYAHTSLEGARFFGARIDATGWLDGFPWLPGAAADAAKAEAAPG